MPSAWNRKDERKFEHIREGYEDRGVSEGRASEIAGRTVNRDRREEGRTPQRSSQGRGNPNTPLESRSVDELRNIASDLDIHGRSKLRKSELIDAIRAERGQG